MHTSTLKHFTPNHPQYDYKQTPTHSHPPSPWHIHKHMRVTTPTPTTHPTQCSWRNNGSRLSCKSYCFAAPPPPPPLTGVNLENRVKAVQRRCVLRPDLKAVTDVIIIITVQMRLYSLCSPRHITCLKDGVIRFVLWCLPRHQHHGVDLLNQRESFRCWEGGWSAWNREQSNAFLSQSSWLHEWTFVVTLTLNTVT